MKKIARRSQGGTLRDWSAWDRAAAAAGYRTTSRWIRDVIRERVKLVQYVIEVKDVDGVWISLRSLRGRTLGEDASAAVLVVLKDQGIQARRVSSLKWGLNA